MDLGLKDAIVLIVGGSGYIGREVARQFASEGAQVVIAGRDQQHLDDATKQLAVDAHRHAVDSCVMDTGSTASVASAIGEVMTRYGKLDVVVLSAAPAAQTLDPAKGFDPDAVLQAVDAKSIGYLRVANAALPVISRPGRIVFIDGQGATLTGNIATSLRNRAVMTISKNLADAAAGTGLTVNVVNPGHVTDNPITEPKCGTSPDVTPAQVASVVVFLASQPASGISGEDVAVGHRAFGLIPA